MCVEHIGISIEQPTLRPPGCRTRALEPSSLFKSHSSRLLVATSLQAGTFIWLILSPYFCSSGFLHHCRVRTTLASFSRSETGLPSSSPSVWSLQVILNKNYCLLSPSSPPTGRPSGLFAISHCGNHFKVAHAISHLGKPD